MIILDAGGPTSNRKLRTALIRAQKQLVGCPAEFLGSKTLILAGLAGNICVLFTANDAYMRDYRLVVPADCVASNSETENRAALEEIEKVLKADIRGSESISLRELTKRTQ
jgi:nicotinamidase-related amidase